MEKSGFRRCVFGNLLLFNAYFDLNPVRASMAKAPESSENRIPNAGEVYDSRLSDGTARRYFAIDSAGLIGAWECPCIPFP